MNKLLLKQEILKSPFIDLIKERVDTNDDIIAILLAGSVAAGTDHSKSDIDVAVLTKKSWDLNPNYRAEFLEQPLHWWVTPFDFGLKSWAYPIYTQLLLVGNYYMTFDQEENFIYINPKYNKLLEFLVETQDEIHFLSLYLLVERFRITQEPIWRKWPKFLAPKTASPLLDFYYKQNNLNVNIELIKKMKNLRDYDGKLSDEEQAEIRKALLWTCDYFKDLDEDAACTWAQWSIKAQKVLKECK